MKEMWKQITDYEGLYEISNYGRVKSVSRWRRSSKGGKGYTTKEKMLATRLNNDGYPTVTLCKDSKSKNKRIHRLICGAFLPNPLEKPQVNHKNGIKYDYRMCNLEWVTREENVQHAYDTGLMSDQHKLTEEDEIMLRKVFGWGYSTMQELADSYGVCRNVVSKAINNKYR